MKRFWAPLAAALPGLFLAAASLGGRVPSERDLPSYFVPLRERTASVLTGRRGAFWDPDVGCGEPYFANPQTGLLYPPDWLATVLPGSIATGVEAGLHLAFLGVGCALLVRRLGGGALAEVAAGWGVVLAGPLSDAVGVLNNLDTLAWMPWLWLSALAGSLPATAACAAAAYLAAEPQLAVLGGAVALSLAPRRRTVAALALAVGLVAVQALPFAAWVSGGDRGPWRTAAEVTAGSVKAAELPAVVFPGAPLPPRSDRFVTRPAIPLWALLLSVAALFGSRPPVRRLATWGLASLAAAVLAGLPAIRELWTLATQGLVTYPGRLMFLAVVALVPAAAARLGTWRVPPWLGAVVAAVAIAGGLVTRADTRAAILAGLAAGAAVAGPLAAPAALLGSAALTPLDVEALALASAHAFPAPACPAAQHSVGRVYSTAPSLAQLAWVSQQPTPRMVDLGWGYLPLLDGRRTVRTSAPLASRALEVHLAAADRGPAGRWWLDTLAADRIVSQHPVDGFPEICRSGDLVVLTNPAAWPETSVVAALPSAGAPLVARGEVRPTVASDDHLAWLVDVGSGGGVLLRLATPDPGWRYEVDGSVTAVLRGPGILHGVPLSAGPHHVTARYRPPLMRAGATISFVSIVVLALLGWRRRRESAGARPGLAIPACLRHRAGQWRAPASRDTRS